MLEIVLAVVILSLVIAGVFGTFLTGKRYIVESAHKIEAINFIRAKLEELKATDYDQLWDGSDTVTFTDGLTGNRVWDVVWVTEGRSIRVDVSWSEEGTTLTESAMTMIADIGD